MDLLSETPTVISGIIGFMMEIQFMVHMDLDDPNTFTTASKLQSGYEKDLSFIKDRPSENDFTLGYFVEDYRYTGTGDLDEHNGRYEKKRFSKWCICISCCS